MKKLIRINKDPNITIASSIEEYLNPNYINIHIDNTCNYKVNDYVYMGTIISNEIISISGKITKIEDNVMTIENDFRELTKEKLPKVNIKDIEELQKYNDKGYEGVVVSAINDNPYIYNRIFLLKTYTREILDVVNSISYLFKIKNNMVAIKNNESFIIDECLNVIGTYPNIKIALTSDEYLIGKEEFLVKKLNMDKAMYFTIEDILGISNKVKGYLRTTKLITISGDAIKESKVIRVKLGTPLKSIIAKFIDVNKKKVNIFVNGLLTGYKVSKNSNVFISNDIDSICIMENKGIKEYPCINCGLCHNVCPEGVSIYNKKNIDKCLDCGLCSYICPSHINLRKYLGDHHE